MHVECVKEKYEILIKTDMINTKTSVIDIMAKYININACLVIDMSVMPFT